MVQKQNAGGQLPDEALPSRWHLPPAASSISCRETQTRETAALTTPKLCSREQVPHFAPEGSKGGSPSHPYQGSRCGSVTTALFLNLPGKLVSGAGRPKHCPAPGGPFLAPLELAWNPG